MNSSDYDQRKRAKWSRWADDRLTDDEDSGSENCRRIVNEPTLLGSGFQRPLNRTATGMVTAPRRFPVNAAVIKPATSVVAMPTPITTPQFLPSRTPQAPSASMMIHRTTTPSYHATSQPAVQEAPSLIVRREESDVLTVFCDDEIPDLREENLSQFGGRPEPAVSPEVQIIAVTKPIDRTSGPPAKQHDLRMTLNKSRSPRQVSTLRHAPPSASGRERQRVAREVMGREIVRSRGPPCDYHSRSSSSGYYSSFRGYHSANSSHRYAPFNGPGKSSHNRDQPPSGHSRDHLPRLHLRDVCYTFRDFGDCRQPNCRYAHRMPSPPPEDRKPGFGPSAPTSDRSRLALPPVEPRSHDHHGYHDIEADGEERDRERGRSNDERNVVFRSGREERPHVEPRYERRPIFERDEDRQEDECKKGYHATMQELLKQNGQLQTNLRHLEEQHHDLELRTCDQNHHISRRLDEFADFQRNLVMNVLRNEPQYRRSLEGGVSLNGIVGMLQQQGVARQPRQPDPRDQIVEEQLARQLIFQHRLQNGQGLTEEQLLMQHGVYDYDHGVLMNRYWHYT